MACGLIAATLLLGGCSDQTELILALHEKERLTLQLAEVQQQKAELQERFDKVAAEVADLEKRLQGSRVEANAAHDQLRQLRKDIAKAAALQMDSRRATELLAAANEQINALKSELIELKKPRTSPPATQP